ncbi:MAG: YbaY family lipoprotein [Desulfobacterales bacterium]|nr:MAG: YbaY family lipoprotein [Desulfobacterales bacterium]
MKRIIEGIVAILLVLLFFSVILSLLNALFPSGTSLREIIVRQKSAGSVDAFKQNSREFELSYSSEGSDSGSSEDSAAVLSWTRNTVKSKRAAEIAWEAAKVGNLLYDRDAVQTFSRSAAEIQFDENNTLSMGPNSLMIIKRLTHDPSLREKRSFMVLVDGELRGMLAQSGQESVYLEIDTPGAKLRTQSGPGDSAPVDFKLSVNPDKSSTIAVYQGSAKITAQGQTVTVNANQSTVVALNQAPLDPRDLPDTVQLKSPLSTSRFYYRDLPPKIQFAWQTQPNATGYHFVLARDSFFHDIITDDHFSESQFSHGNLKEGIYFWKVSAMQETIEGLFSENRRFRVEQDQTAPELSVHFPPRTIYNELYTLRGKTEPGARVFVGGKRIKTSQTGKFEYQLKLSLGINVIVVEAYDAVNNVAYRSQRVNRKI